MDVTQENQIRYERGMEIAKTSRIMRSKSGFVVPSQSGSGAYVVRYESMKHTCECPDFEKKGVLGIKCKHIFATEITIRREQDKDGNTTITKTIKMSYPQNWSAYNEAQTHEKELFMKLLSELTKDVSEPYVFGRPKLPLSETIFCSALKIYSTLSSRRTVDNFNVAVEKGYLDKAPHFNAVSKILNEKRLTSILLDLIVKSSLPLTAIETDFAIDSSGFGTSLFSRWFNFKYGKEMNSRVWLKTHVVSGTKTNIITAIKITDSFSHDSKEFPILVERTAENFTINELSADKAYSSRENLEIVESLGGTAYIPFKNNVTGKARGSALWKKMYHLFQYNREEFLQHYHKRSNVETTFSMVKRKFGSFVRSKNRVAQENEILLKVLCHNLCVVIQEIHELGIEADFAPKENEVNLK